MVRIAFVLAVILVALTPATASARSCGTAKAKGVHWIVGAGDTAREKRDVSCRDARAIVKRFIRTGRAPAPWRCRHSLATKRCVKGGTHIDEFGNRAWRYVIFWHRGD